MGCSLKINNLLNIIRSVHKSTIIIVTDYSKFRMYNEDAIISNYLFKYDIHKLKDYNFIINKIEYLNYVKFNLRKIGINYIVVDKHDGYNIISEYKEDNNYYEIYLKRSKIYYKRMKIINKIRKVKDIEKINLIKEKLNYYGLYG